MSNHDPLHQPPPQPTTSTATATAPADDSAPRWAMALVERIEHLEEYIHSSSQHNTPTTPMEADDNNDAPHEPDNGSDPYINERTSDSDFTPYPAFREALQGCLEKDFFRSLLPEAERRRFLSECPCNLAREYNPPVLNSVNVSKTARRTDQQLQDVQYRLSGITRPLDYFLHGILRDGAPSAEDAI
ncbi:hypothetical protein INT45_010611 [Circinella minor]|uniref:Uncharacterized protein n=1 Tax=Circinella minor TaxID=1195481 RepID=A0A8H7RZB9_9FUNG|nr:hypothetical protein INT45_010611 [Circinella minor]